MGEPHRTPEADDSVLAEQLAEDMRSSKSMTTTELHELRIELGGQMATYQNKVKRLARRISKLSTEIKRRLPNESPVTDHAILRYLQRVNGVDIDAIRERIESSIPENHPVGTQFEVDGLTYQVSPQGKVTTLYRPEKKDEQSHD